jgi:hypothetical protein
MLKFAITTTSVRFGDVIVRLAQDDPWHADDPFVKARPDLFADTPSRVFGVYGTRKATPAVIEQATAKPGEPRRVK